MAISTYNNLQAAIGNWLVRADLTDRIPEFIALAEAKFNRDLRVNQMEVRAVVEVDTGSDEPEFVSLPSDFQTMRRARLSAVAGKPRLCAVSQQQADMLRYERRDMSGQPVYFTVFGDEMELIPTPDDDYEIEMVYRANIPALASNATNWLLTDYPDIYLYGSLLEAQPYLQEDDRRLQIWAAALASAIEGLHKVSFDQSYLSTPIAVRLEGPAP